MDIESIVTALSDLDGPELRQRWKTLTGSPAPRISPKLLRLALAWHIQADALGGLSPSVRRRLAQAAGGKTMTRTASAGMRLVREWQGVAHVVTIDENGTIVWNERAGFTNFRTVISVNRGHRFR